MKKAFTLLELVFVIVVIGILAAMIIPSTRTNPLQEAAVQVLSDIRYTQHLAMVDDKYDANDLNWFRGRWQIVFGNNNGFANNKPAYTIFSDSSPAYSGDPMESEVAKNPQNSNQIMTGGYSVTAALDYNNPGFKGMKKLNLGESYGVTQISFGGGCNLGLRISFDHLGRPLTGDAHLLVVPYTAGRLITSDCNIILDDGDDNISITIRPETGYASITF